MGVTWTRYLGCHVVVITSKHHDVQEAKLQFRAEVGVPLLLDPNATAPSAAEDAEATLQPDSWQRNTENRSSSSISSSWGQARRLLRSAPQLNP
jgi:hypothetical protein